MRSTRIGKKGTVEETLTHFAIMLFVAYVIIIIIALYFMTTAKRIEIEEAELKIIANRAIYEASLYDKETGRAYTGIIQDNALAEEQLNKAIDFGQERRLGARIQIGNNIVMYNGKWFERLNPRAGYDVKKVEQKAYLVHNSEGKITEIEAVT